MFLTQAFYSVVPFLILLLIIVFVHELGHYFFARINGVHVEDFAIGYGSQKMLSFTDKRGTCWSLRPIPFGGFAKMKGDASASSASQVFDENLKKDQASILSKSPFQKFLIAIGGPLFNFIFSFLLLFGIYFSYGKLVISPIVGNVQQNSIAQKIGIKIEDKILEINQNKINNFEDIQKNIILTNILNFDIKLIDKKGNIFTKIIKFPNSKEKKLGISPKERFLERLKIKDCFNSSYEFLLDNIKTTILSFKMLILGQISKDNIGGPLSIAKHSKQASQSGLYSFLMLMVVISINLGVLNLLPIPIVDGGQALIHIVEILIRKDLTYSNFKKYFMYLGYFIVGCLMFLAMFNDLRKAFF